jgi:3',5'-cyclic AMP phosphodiesterase CpdA
MTGRALHISDLHRGKRELPEVDEALVALANELRPDVVVVTGDLSNRGTRPQLERARALIDRLAPPALVVPGNHDLPYRFPARFTAPSRLFEELFGDLPAVFRSETIVACGLNSTRPWRHQGGALGAESLRLAAEQLASAPPGALRVVAFHHHLAGAPWRAARKLPLARRQAALEALRRAGAEVVLGGHIHQATAVSTADFTAPGPDRQVLLVTAPGLGRPRPSRLGEAHGLQVVEWTADDVVVETRIWQQRADGTGTFRPAGRRTFERGA